MSESLDELLIGIRNLIDAYLQKKKPRKVYMQEVAEAFPKELGGLLILSETEKHILAKPKAYLSTEQFKAVAKIVKGLGGEYISAGKDSHFKIQK